MTQIKKVKTSEGVQFYPQTHTKAVIDDNGYTAESRLGAMQDEINNLQEGVVVVGEGMTPVPSDLAPTEDSSNWVTSGGVYNAIQVVQSDVAELAGNVDGLMTEVGGTAIQVNLASYSDVMFTIDASGVWATTLKEFHSIFVPMQDGEYTLTASTSTQALYTVLTSNATPTAGATPAYATGYSNRISIPAGGTVTVQGTTGLYLWMRNDTATTGAMAPTVMFSSGTSRIDELYKAIEDGYTESGTVNVLTEYDISSMLATGVGFSSSSFITASAVSSILLPYVEGAVSVTVTSSTSFRTNEFKDISHSVTKPSNGLTATWVAGEGYGTGTRTFTLNSQTERMSLQFQSNNATTILNGLTQVKISYQVVRHLLKDNDIVNNTTDGGADKVLSAEQGKILGAKVKELDYVASIPTATFENFTNVGQTDATIASATLDSSTSSIKFEGVGEKADKKYAWVVLPSNLVYGQQYIMSFDYEANIGVSPADGWLALSSSTTSPGWGTGVNLRTGSGSSKIMFTKGSYNYLMTAANSLGGIGCYIYLSNIKIVAYDGQEYDNLKMLTDKVNSIIPSIPSSVTTAEYKGERIPSLTSFATIGVSKFSSTGASYQGGAIYGNYFFLFPDKHPNVKIYDLTTKTFHSTVTTVRGENDHCNNASFSNIFYDANDEFPLVYTSGSNTGSYNHIQVWRIQINNNVFTITKVQEITLPTGAADNNWWWSDVYLDNEKGYMWVATNIKGHHFKRFAIPAVESNGEPITEVTLTDENVLSEFTSASFVRHQQGGVMRNGVLYLLDGVPEIDDYCQLLVYNVWGGYLMNALNLTELFGIAAEFEGVGIWNGTLIADTYGSGFYQIYI